MPLQTLHSLVVDRYNRWVGKQVCGSSAAVDTTHWLGTRRCIGRLNIDHLVAVILCILLKEVSAVHYKPCSRGWSGSRILLCLSELSSRLLYLNETIWWCCTGWSQQTQTTVMLLQHQQSCVCVFDLRVRVRVYLCLALCCCSLLSSALSSIQLREIPVLEREDTALDKVLDLRGIHTHIHTHIRISVHRASTFWHYNHSVEPLEFSQLYHLCSVVSLKLLFWKVNVTFSISCDLLGQTNMAQVRNNSATFSLFGILTHFCGYPHALWWKHKYWVEWVQISSGCHDAAVEALEPRASGPSLPHNCRNDASNWSYLLAMDRSFSFLPSREARCCSRASRRELGALGGKDGFEEGKLEWPLN